LLNKFRVAEQFLVAGFKSRPGTDLKSVPTLVLALLPGDRFINLSPNEPASGVCALKQTAVNQNAGGRMQPARRGNAQLVARAGNARYSAMVGNVDHNNLLVAGFRSRPGTDLKSVPALVLTSGQISNLSRLPRVQLSFWLRPALDRACESFNYPLIYAFTL
jgi:hypothetical protein